MTQASRCRCTLALAASWQQQQPMPAATAQSGEPLGDLDVRDSPWLTDFNWLELIERDMKPPWVPSELFLRDTVVQHMAHGWPDSSDTYYHGDL
eukprot:11097-Heterococcus_DN1.PRE.4